MRPVEVKQLRTYNFLMTKLTLESQSLTDSQSLCGKMVGSL